MTSQKTGSVSIGCMDGHPDWLQARELRLRMAHVMPFNALWKQAFAAALAAACQGCATPFCLHAGTKTMLTFACSLGWLVSALHNTDREPRHDLGAVTVGATLALSTLLAA
jgi:hypothetical protein